MAISVSYGNAQEFNALVYGVHKHPGTLQFLENQFNNVSQVLTDASRSFFADTKQMFEKFNGEEAIRIGLAATRKVSHLFQRDQLRFIWDIGDFQQAPLTMQRYLMAEPTTRAIFHAGRCDGYGDTYVDMYPNDIGEKHYDYRRVMNGVVEETEDGWKATTYIDDLVEGDRELMLSEQADILNSWGALASWMGLGKDDPTSPFNNKL